MRSLYLIRVPQGWSNVGILSRIGPTSGVPGAERKMALPLSCLDAKVIEDQASSLANFGKLVSGSVFLTSGFTKVSKRSVDSTLTIPTLVWRRL